MNIILLCRSVWWWGRVVIVISGAKSGGLAHTPRAHAVHRDLL